MATRRFIEFGGSSVLPWLGAWIALGCVGDLGELGEVPDPPQSATPPLFQPITPDAGPSESEPVVEPTTPLPAPIVQPAPVDPEPNGRGVFTLVHGVIDSPWGAFCAVLDDMDGTRFSPTPMPRAGMGFGAAVVVPMEGAIDPQTTAVRFFFVAADDQHLAQGCASLLAGYGYALPDSAQGVELEIVSSFAYDAGVGADAGAGFGSLFGSEGADPSAFDVASRALVLADAGVVDSGASATTLDASSNGGGLDAGAEPALADAAGPDAATLDAGARDAGADFVPPAVRVAELPRLLAGTYLDRSYLFATGGCLGAPGLDATEVHCGPGFDADRSSFSAVFTPLSRVVAFDAVGLQVVHANPTLGELTVRSDPEVSEGAFFTLASGLVLGGVQPFTAQRTIDVVGLGEPLSAVTISVASSPGGYPVLDVSWPEALAPNQIELHDARAFTLVLIGGEPGLPGPYSNPTALTAIESDPLRE